MTAGLYLRNERKNYSVDNATEHHRGFLKALNSITKKYPEIKDFDIQFDGPWKKVSDVLHQGKETFNWRTVKFLHGTSSAAWGAIKEKGLMSRSKSGSSSAYGTTVSASEGDPNAIYLTTQETMSAWAARDAAKVTKSEPVILIVDGRGLDSRYLEPDEDNRESTPEASLAKMGSVKYKRVIHPKYIKVRK